MFACGRAKGPCGGWAVYSHSVLRDEPLWQSEAWWGQGAGTHHSCHHQERTCPNCDPPGLLSDLTNKQDQDCISQESGR